MSWLSKKGGRNSPQTGAANGTANTTAVSRPSAPPKILIDRHEYQPEEFVIGSFRIRPYDGDLIAKQQFDFRLSFDLGGESHEFVCRGIVVRLDEQSGLVARYQPPQPFYERKLIEYMRLWKGV